MKLQEAHATASQYQINPGILPIAGSIHENRRQEQVIRMGFDWCSSSSPHPSAIRAMQRQRGEEPCFSTDKRYSCAEPCEWRKDCLKLRAVWLR